MAALLQVLEHAVQCEVGALLHNGVIADIVHTTWRLSRVQYASHLLQQTAETSLAHILLAIFSRLDLALLEELHARPALPAAQGEDAPSPATATAAAPNSANSRVEPTPDGSASVVSLSSLVTPGVGYDLTCAQLLSWLANLVNPASPAYEQSDPNEQSRIQYMALRLVNMLLEAAGQAIARSPACVHVVQAELCKYLVASCRTHDLALLALTLRVIFNLFVSMRAHLKVQLEVFFMSVHLGLADDPSSRPEYRELALESLLEFCREAALMVDVYVNYDCDVACTNLYETLVQRLAAAATPRGQDMFTTLHALALEGLLAIVSNLAAAAVRAKSAPVSSPGGLSEGAPDDVDHALDAETLRARRAYKRRVMLAAARFNSDSNVVKNRWLPYVKELELLPAEAEAADIARWFRTCPGLDKTRLGEYMGEPDEPGKELHTAVRKEYIRLFDFHGVGIDEALRTYLESFRMPGEAQKVERMMEAFAEHYWAQEPGPLASSDTAFILAYSIIMLHTDLHNQHVARKMTPEDFIRTNRGISGGDSLPAEYLLQIYERIKAKEIRLRANAPGTAGGDQPSSQDEASLTVQQWDGVLARAGDVSAFTGTAGATDLSHIKDMFGLLAEPALQAFSAAWRVTRSHTTLARIAAGWRDAACIAQALGDSVAADRVVSAAANCHAAALQAALHTRQPSKQALASGETVCLRPPAPAGHGGTLALLGGAPRTQLSEPAGPDSQADGSARAHSASSAEERGANVGAPLQQLDPVDAHAVLAAQRMLIASAAVGATLRTCVNQLQEGWPAVIRSVMSLYTSRGLPHAALDTDDVPGPGGAVLPSLRSADPRVAEVADEQVVRASAASLASPVAGSSAGPHGVAPGDRAPSIPHAHAGGHWTRPVSGCPVPLSLLAKAPAGAQSAGLLAALTEGLFGGAAARDPVDWCMAAQRQAMHDDNWLNIFGQESVRLSKPILHAVCQALCAGATDASNTAEVSELEQRVLALELATSVLLWNAKRCPELVDVLLPGWASALADAAAGPATPPPWTCPADSPTLYTRRTHVLGVLLERTTVNVLRCAVRWTMQARDAAPGALANDEYWANPRATEHLDQLLGSLSSVPADILPLVAPRLACGITVLVRSLAQLQTVPAAAAVQTRVWALLTRCATCFYALPGLWEALGMVAHNAARLPTSTVRHAIKLITLLSLTRGPEHTVAGSVAALRVVAAGSSALQVPLYAALTKAVVGTELPALQTHAARACMDALATIGQAHVAGPYPLPEDAQRVWAMCLEALQFMLVNLWRHGGGEWPREMAQHAHLLPPCTPRAIASLLEHLCAVLHRLVAAPLAHASECGDLLSASLSAVLLPALRSMTVCLPGPVEGELPSYLTPISALPEFSAPITAAPAAYAACQSMVSIVAQTYLAALDSNAREHALVLWEDVVQHLAVQVAKAQAVSQALTTLSKQRWRTPEACAQHLHLANAWLDMAVQQLRNLVLVADGAGFVRAPELHGATPPASESAVQCWNSTRDIIRLYAPQVLAQIMPSPSESRDEEQAAAADQPVVLQSPPPAPPAAADDHEPADAVNAPAPVSPAVLPSVDDGNAPAADKEREGEPTPPRSVRSSPSASSAGSAANAPNAISGVTYSPQTASASVASSAHARATPMETAAAQAQDTPADTSALPASAPSSPGSSAEVSPPLTPGSAAAGVEPRARQASAEAQAASAAQERSASQESVMQRVEALDVQWMMGML